MSNPPAESETDTPTPLTDAVVFYQDAEGIQHLEPSAFSNLVTADFARALERENTAITRRVEDLEAQLAAAMKFTTPASVAYLSTKTP